MNCRLCAWLCDRFCPPEANTAVWRVVHDWEEGFATDWEPAEQGDDVRKGWAKARVLELDDPAAALAIHRKLAEGGSPHSMVMTGWHYEGGRGVERDTALAEEFYRRALCAGSWRGTLAYARLLFERGAHDKWPSTLGDGVDAGFIPSYFWLAWYRYKLSPKRKTAHEGRPLLEAAARMGHPGARLTLGRLMARGNFGLREIPDGFRMLRALFRWLTESVSSDAASPSLAAENRERDPDVAAPGEKARRALG